MRTRKYESDPMAGFDYVSYEAEHGDFSHVEPYDEPDEEEEKDPYANYDYYYVATKRGREHKVYAPDRNTAVDYMRHIYGAGCKYVGLGDYDDSEPDVKVPIGWRK